MANYDRPTYQQVLDTLIGEGKDLMTAVKNWRVGGVVYTLLATVAKGFSKLYDVVDSALAMAFYDTSKGVYLDRIATLLDAPRTPASKAEGRVMFGRDVTGIAREIAVGRVVGTVALADGQPRRFVVAETTTLPAGSLEVEVPVIAQAVGAAYNVAAGQIDQLITPVTGIDYVSNELDTYWLDTEGTDRETDEAVQARLPLALARPSVPGARTLYESIALPVEGVLSARSWPHGVALGQCDLMITGGAIDAQPSPALVAEVQAALDAVKPDLENIVVRGPDAKIFDIEVTVTQSLAGGEAAQIAVDVKAAIADLFLPSSNERAFGIGNGFVRAALAAEIMQVPYVANVNVIVPDADETVDTDELLRTGTVTVYVVGA